MFGRINWGIAIVALAATGCAGEGPQDGRLTGAGAGIDVDEATDTADEPDESGGKADDANMLDVGSSEPADDDEECQAFTEVATPIRQPADIIFAVDNSGSMMVETQAVQDNLNAFSQEIAASGIDVRVVLISSYPDEQQGICIEPPLGNGGCPTSDTNPPLFTHIDQLVLSDDAFELILDHQPSWGPLIRQDASLHVVIVSDDDADIGSTVFDYNFTAFDESYADYRFHGIVSMQDCTDAANIGTEYIELAEMTGGVVRDLCLQDFQPVFDELAEEVVVGSEISCEWTIPEPPEGETLDPTKVNVNFNDGEGNGGVIGFVESAADCGSVLEGWYYDNPADPTTIFACPQTCDRINGLLGASVEVSFGCATVPAG